MSVEDPIADALLGESAYERLQAERHSLFQQSLTRKLTWQSYLLFSLAGLYPALAVLPEAVRRAYLPERIGFAAPKVAFVGLVAVSLVALTGAGHAAVGVWRLRLGRTMNETQARELLNAEAVCSLLGFFTGSFATAMVHAFVLLGFGGVDAVERYVAAGGGNPFAQTGLGVTVVDVSVLALVSAVCLLVSAALLSVEASVRGFHREP
ncbi:hypothetical protein [Haloprofundus sp. MHR1]|uniref:hypothetical protein n=1 Tax=Haloprofundus sp. MHR1 TaxID=2572921 RepID=UPI0010BF48E9|nr:hypothetical protein [Haloprofundus sp. MHR1]QCJ46484.1 hypothetical protein FCF25_04835 [Haloprofundus sp. MHR1]